MKGAFIVFLMIFLSTTTYADTLLVGYDSANYEPTCFQTARNLTNRSWKAFSVSAAASGNISYFKFRLRESTVSTNDELAWAIYADSNNNVGALMAYGYYPSYNWTTLGVGPHTFNVTTVVTTTQIVQGNKYWLVIYSRDMDNSIKQIEVAIPTERGGYCVQPHNKLSTNQNRWLVINIPPTPNEYEVPVASYHAWSVWQRSGLPDPTPPAAPTGLRIVQ